MESIFLLIGNICRSILVKEQDCGHAIVQVYEKLLKY